MENPRGGKAAEVSLRQRDAQTRATERQLSHSSTGSKQSGGRDLDCAQQKGHRPSRNERPRNHRPGNQPWLCAAGELGHRPSRRQSERRRPGFDPLVPAHTSMARKARPPDANRLDRNSPRGAASWPANFPMKPIRFYVATGFLIAGLAIFSVGMLFAEPKETNEQKSAAVNKCIIEHS